MKIMKYRKFLNVFVLFFALICLVVSIYSIFNIVNWKKSVFENDKIKDKISNNITVVEPEEGQELKYDIDFESLRKLNKDAISYVKLNNTNIDYIVVRGYDNNYYLNHNFLNESNVAGWIFSDYRNKFDGSDKNIVLFGHNTRDGSMFGTLKNILDKDWYENPYNYSVVLVTEKNTYYYQVFSTYSTSVEDYYINTQFSSNDEFDFFVKNLKSRSIYDYGVEVFGDDKILTLSSCLGDGSKRVVLHAKLVEN